MLILNTYIEPNVQSTIIYYYIRTIKNQLTVEKPQIDNNSLRLWLGRYEVGAATEARLGSWPWPTRGVWLTWQSRTAELYGGAGTQLVRAAALVACPLPVSCGAFASWKRWLLGRGLESWTIHTGPLQAEAQARVRSIRAVSLQLLSLFTMVVLLWFHTYLIV